MLKKTYSSIKDLIILTFLICCMIQFTTQVYAQEQARNYFADSDKKNLSPSQKLSLNTLQTPNWVDTKNTTGPKVYIDTNNQYYFEWGQVYTIKYEKDGKPLYTQIELKGLRGNRAAILSVDAEYKKTYDIPITRKYKNISPNQAIYNSSRMALLNTNKKSCPSNICKYAGTVDDVYMRSYLKDMQRRIKMNWHPPKGNESKHVVLSFKIAKDGRLIDLQVHKSSGDKETDEAALKAVQSTVFKPLPYVFQGESADIQFTFDYNVIGSSSHF